jgi:GDP-4-dehydro-6-deoxy-D-mannose reductase
MPSRNIMNILITGALGFVGRHVTAELERADHAVYRHDVEYDRGVYYSDLRDADSVQKLVRALTPDACIHLAGLPFVPLGWKDPRLVYNVNLMGTVNLLEALRLESPDTKTLVISSSLVYKATEDQTPVGEDAQMHPPDIYAISKIAADLTALGYAQKYGMHVMTARPINHIGPGQSPEFVTSAFAAQLRGIAAGRREPVMKVGNLESRRDFVDVRDVARAYRLLLEKGRPGEAYNVATGRLHSIGAMLDLLCDIAGLRPDIVVDPDLYRPTDSSPVMDITKIRAHTGWEPRTDLRVTLEDIYRSVAGVRST